MEEKQSEISIPKVKVDTNDKKMLTRIAKFKAGSIRILLFTIVGMTVGWFSYTYTTDSFIITKIIFSIPYKISEAIYTSIIGTGNTIAVDPLFANFTEYFPHSLIATFLAERITPVILGGALFGGLAYFTGDKRVFTMQRFVKFTSLWVAVIVIFIGCVYGVNAKAEYDNNHLKNIEYFYLVSADQGESILDKERADKLLKAFESELKLDTTIERKAGEISLEIYFAHGLRSMVAEVNCKEGYLVTQNGTIYSISKEFAGYVNEYYETGKLMGIQNIYTE